MTTATAKISGNHWEVDYKSKVMSADSALAMVKSGDSIWIHSNAAAPQALVSALVRHAEHLKDVQIFQLLTLGKAEYSQAKYRDSFKLHALFIGTNIREAVNLGVADYTPVFLSEVPELIKERVFPVDVCLINVSPPDKHGYCSYGVSVDCTIAARKAAKIVIAQVNKNMPRTMGRAFVHSSKFDAVVEIDEPLPQLTIAAPNAVEAEIGRNVASLIQDGATLQMGIGAIPNAVLSNLHSKSHLGIHTEMFSDGIIELIESGNVTNDMKTLMPGKAAVSFAMGTQKLYEYVDNNPFIEFQTSDFINDPFIIAQNYRMTAINSALEVDITGQVGADSVGEQLYSGFGGQLDFIRGAARSKEGRPIIAMPSTARGGTLSRIVPHISGGVVTTRGDVHYVVTEYGIASLYGKNLKARAAALISIAHPDFRPTLQEYVKCVAWLH